MPGVRCEGCDGKFGSNGDVEIEVESCDVEGTMLEASVTLSISCGNCGDSDFKKASLDVSEEIDFDPHNAACSITDPGNGEVVTMESDEDRFTALIDLGERDIELVEHDAALIEDYRPKTETKTRADGTTYEKKLPLRAQTHWYDVVFTLSLRCRACNGDFEAVVTGSVAGSEFEAA